MSTSELAPILNSAQRRIRFAPAVGAVGVLVVAAALQLGSELWLSVAGLYALIAVLCANSLDRYRRSISVIYDLGGAAEQISGALKESFGDLRASNCVWTIPAEGQTSDWKRNAGATTLVKRKKISLALKRPNCIRNGPNFPTISTETGELFFLPDAALVVTNSGVTALHYRDLMVSLQRTRFVEDERVPRDATVVDETWRFVAKNGGPDRRFNFNKRLPVCLYGELEFSAAGGMRTKIQYSNGSAGDRFSNVIQVLREGCPSAAESKAFTSFQSGRKWPSVVFYSFFVTITACILLPLVLPSNLQRKASTFDATGRKEQGGLSGNLATPAVYRAMDAMERSPQARPFQTAATSSVGVQSPTAQLPTVTHHQVPSPIPLPRPRPKTDNGERP